MSLRLLGFFSSVIWSSDLNEMRVKLLFQEVNGANGFYRRRGLFPAQGGQLFDLVRRVEYEAFFFGPSEGSGEVFSVFDEEQIFPEDF